MQISNLNNLFLTWLSIHNNLAYSISKESCLFHLTSGSLFDLIFKAFNQVWMKRV